MKSNVCKILGNNIKRLRSARNLTQNKLAELLNIEVKSLSLIETGKGFASAKTIEKIAAILDVQYTELFHNCSKDTNIDLYSKILSHLEYIKNNTQKLEAIELILRNII